MNLRSVEHVAPRHAARPHQFAGATRTKLRRAERVCFAAPRITLRLLRLRNSAVPSAFRVARRHPSITSRELRLRLSGGVSAAAPSMLLCCLAGSGLVL